ncbi:hypothetical protein CYMTET_31769 [Cymbomonas tetramitiformis]|uniref:Uncharacterized protein n=1 Tax=Cymbomonas tetramitiformis TaxID=36881 RepID=A0AAE0FGB9_9CHLO|nr:hypothetical protein CYMTET_31769 [Cymbomonas tetramitiformis]
MFLGEVRRLAKKSFDERAAKLVIKKVYDDKHGRFDGTESNVNSVFDRLVMALRDIFVIEEDAFSSLFDLEDATLPVCAEANMPLFSTLEYIIAPVSPAADWMDSSAEAHPFDGKRVLLEIARMLLDSGGPFQGTADLLAIKITQFDPSRTIAAFNAAIRSARQKSTLDDMEVKSLSVHQVPRPGFRPCRRSGRNTAPQAPPSAPQSVVSDGELYPVSALHAHEPHVSFMDKFAVNLNLTGPEPTLAMHSMGAVAPVDSVSVATDDSEDDDEGLPPPRQALGCGRPPMGFGFSALTSLAVCMLFFVCATAMPFQDHSAQASSATPEHTGDEVGGAGVLTPTTVPPALYWRPEGWYPNDHGSHLGTLWPWYPGPSQPPEAAPIVTVPPSPGGAPPSPIYVPPPTRLGRFGPSSSIEHRIRLVAPGATDFWNIGTFSTFSFCSTHDLPNSGTNSPGRCNRGTGSPGHSRRG